jgi:hypothetical protein
MTHFEFVENYRSGRIKVHVHKMQAVKLVRRMPRRYSVAQALWIGAWFFSFPVAIACFIWLKAWIGGVVLFLGLGLPAAIRRSAAEFVLEYAIENPSFYDYLIANTEVFEISPNQTAADVVRVDVDPTPAPPEASDLVSRYSTVLQFVPAKTLLPISLLPAPKDEIKRALLAEARGPRVDSHVRDVLRTAYSFLALFVNDEAARLDSDFWNSAGKWAEKATNQAEGSKNLPLAAEFNHAPDTLEAHTKSMDDFVALGLEFDHLTGTRPMVPAESTGGE